MGGFEKVFEFFWFLYLYLFREISVGFRFIKCEDKKEVAGFDVFGIVLDEVSV